MKIGIVSSVISLMTPFILSRIFTLNINRLYHESVSKTLPDRSLRVILILYPEIDRVKVWDGADYLQRQTIQRDLTHWITCQLSTH